MQQIAFIVGKWTLVCLLLLLPGCDEQVGRFTVSQRTSQQLGGGGRIDFFWGKAIGGSAASDGELLLVFVSYAEERHFTEILENSGDGRVVSTLNLTFNSTDKPSFHFGSIWNRENDRVGIDSQSYHRANGSVFLVMSDLNYSKSVKQLQFDFQGESVTQIQEFVVSKLANDYTNDLPRALINELNGIKKN